MYDVRNKKITITETTEVFANILPPTSYLLLRLLSKTKHAIPQLLWLKNRIL
jgi:hypothetical protein